MKNSSEFLKNLTNFFVVKPWSNTRGRTGYTPPKKKLTHDEFVLVGENADNFNNINPEMSVVIVTPDDEVSERISVKELVKKANKHNKSLVFATGPSIIKKTPPLPEEQENTYSWNKESSGRRITRKKKHTGKKHTGKKHTGKKHTGKKHTGKKHTGKKHTGKKHTGKKHTGKKHTGKKHTGKKHTGSRRNRKK